MEAAQPANSSCIGCGVPRTMGASPLSNQKRCTMLHSTLHLSKLIRVHLGLTPLNPLPETAPL